MKGTVKWFSIEKGYGFITGDDGIDRHFTVSDVQGLNLPRNGSRVEFRHAEGRKGPRAQLVIIEQSTQFSDIVLDRADKSDRVKCSGCSRRMVPRVITDKGELSRSVCPFCGATYKRFSGSYLTAISVIIALIIIVLLFLPKL